MLTFPGPARQRRLALLAVAPDLELLRTGGTGALINARPRSGVHGPTQRALPERRAPAVLCVAVQADAVARRAVSHGAIRLALLVRGDEILPRELFGSGVERSSRAARAER
eukprot:1163189-Alexandrium_andersonii.AAC.1